MNIINELTDDNIIVCNDHCKKSILKELNKNNGLYNVKFFNIKELYNSMYFSYDIKAINFLIKEYNIKYDVALTYLNSLIYVDDKVYHKNKIDKLVNIKNKLSLNNLIITDEYFNDYIKNKMILFFGFDFLDKFMQKSINSLKKITEVKIIEKETKKYKHDVIEFDHIENEVEYVASSICKLINNGIDINKIKLSNVSEEYNYSITRIFKMYNIPVELDNKTTLASTIIGKFFIDNFDDDINKTIELLIDKYNDNIVNQIIDVINKYSFTQNKNEVKDMIIHDLFDTCVKSNTLVNCIDLIDYDDYVDDSEYVFLLNFNEGSIPKVIKDEDYLSNNDKTILELSTTIDISNMVKIATINNINNIKNLVITYKKESYNNSYSISNLINDIDCNIIHEDINHSYSVIANKVKLCKDLDKYYKYNICSDELTKLNSNYDISYRKYDNKFSGILPDSFNKIINNKLLLSYSSMQSYNECSFKYYINNILKLDPYEDTFSAYIGTIFHHILEIGIKNNINVRDEVCNFVSQKILTEKEKFFIDKLINDMDSSLKYINDSLRYTSLNNIKTENKFEILIKENPYVAFKGYVDKVMMLEDKGRTYVAIVDYKTYDSDIKLDLLNYGLNIQLPVYLYLVNSSIKNATFTGFYLQKVLSGEIKYNKDTSLTDQKEDSMKLNGYSNMDEDIIKLFDSSYKDSNIIKGLKFTNDRVFSSSSKVLTNGEIESLIKKVNFVINECINNILSAKFDINPKIYKDNNISCKYCKYNDICYKSASDEVNIVVEEGEDDA